jgi:predicted RNA-binding Zn ribbon-like protein
VPVIVEPMDLTRVVALVNGWATMPRQIDPTNERSVPEPAPGVADALFGVFAAADDARRAELVTELLAETGVRPVLRTVDGRSHPSWTVDEPGRAELASAALALRAQLAAHPGRIGVCADDKCADVYVDASPGGHRRFCSLTCQNRSRTAAFRRRRAGQPAR